MLTLFSTPKPFRGHIGIIQRNAIKSWTLLRPGVEVILFGDDEGTAEACREFGIRHEPKVSRDECGMKHLDYLIGRAQQIASHPVLCFINCDIMLTGGFLKALELVALRHRRFLMVGRRWNTDITVPWDFERSDWEQRLETLAVERGKQVGPLSIDYFAFTRDLYDRIPPFATGCFHFDHWLVWQARASATPVIDASACVMAIHQNHDYAHIPTTAYQKENERNFRLAGGRRHLYSIEDANLKLTPSGIEPNAGYRLAPSKRVILRWWIALMKVTAPVRHPLGLHPRGIKSFMSRIGLTRS